MWKKTSRTNGWWDRAGHILLFVLFCFVIVICVFVLIGAYFTYQLHHLKIEDTLRGISETVENSHNDPNGVKGTFQYFLEQLDTISKGAAQSGTISFLFTVFSVALFSGGAYLLECSRQNLREAEKANRKTKQFIEDSASVLKISDYFSSAEGGSRRLQEGITDYLAYERDLLKAISMQLEGLVGKGEIDPLQVRHFLDQAIEIRMNLESWLEDKEAKVELISRCAKIINLLEGIKKNGD